MYHWNSPALVQTPSKACFILNKKGNALQWMQYKNKTWLLWVRYCSFYARCCPQWDDSSRHSEKNLTLGSWRWGRSCFEDLLVGIVLPWHSALGLSVAGIGGGQNTQIACLVLMQGSTPCLGLLKLASMCRFPAVERGRGLPIWCGTWASRDARRSSAAGGAQFPYTGTCHPMERPRQFSQTWALRR